MMQLATLKILLEEIELEVEKLLLILFQLFKDLEIKIYLLNLE